MIHWESDVRDHRGGAIASIGINGLGRFCRAALSVIGAETVAVSELLPPGDLASLLRDDTVCSRWP